MTNSAAETKSIGISADAHAVMLTRPEGRTGGIFSRPLINFTWTKYLLPIYRDSVSWQFHLDEITYVRLSGFGTLTNFI